MLAATTETIFRVFRVTVKLGQAFVVSGRLPRSARSRARLFLAVSLRSPSCHRGKEQLGGPHGESVGLAWKHTRHAKSHSTGLSHAPLTRKGGTQTPGPREEGRFVIS